MKLQEAALNQKFWTITISSQEHEIIVCPPRWVGKGKSKDGDAHFEYAPQVAEISKLNRQLYQQTFEGEPKMVLLDIIAAANGSGLKAEG